MRILITSGATRELIDEVRFITNFSTGNTAGRLTEIMQKEHEITFVYSEGSKIPKGCERLISYNTFNDLNKILSDELSQIAYDVVIQVAAIGDYKIDKVITDGNEFEAREIKKISSDSELTIKLKSNFKLISKLQEYSVNKNINIIGFKLTSTTNKNEQVDKIKKVMSFSRVSMVIHNDMNDIKKNERIFTIYKGASVIKQLSGVDELGIYLNREII